MDDARTPRPPPAQTLADIAAPAPLREQPERARVERCVAAYQGACRRAHGSAPPRRLRPGSDAYQKVAGAAAALAEVGIDPMPWARWRVEFLARYAPRLGLPPLGAVFSAGAVRKRAGQYQAEALQHVEMPDATPPRAVLEAMLRRRERVLVAEGTPPEVARRHPSMPVWYRALRAAECRA